MARVTFEDVDTVPDILDQVNFALIFGALPGVGNSTDLTLKCSQTNEPGVGNDAYEATMHGFTLSYSGRKTWPRTLSVTFYEDQNFSTLTKLRTWMEYGRGSESNNSQGYKADYSVTAKLITYDSTGKAINSTLFINMFPQDLPDTTRDGTSSGAVTVQATFKYDRAEPSTIELL